MGRIRASLYFRARRLGRRTLYRDGSLDTMWVRQVMNRAVGELLEDLGPTDKHAVEVSGTFWAAKPCWGGYQSLEYPQFDLVNPPTEFSSWSSFDVAIAEQVLEHVVDPVRAATTLVALCRPGGKVVVSTPFLVRLHPQPGDYWRFTPDGLRILLEHVGLRDVQVWSWGNRRCVRANLRRWTPHRRWRSLHNETNFPLVVWAVGTRP